MIKLKPDDVAESETAITKSVDIKPDKTDNTPGLPDQQNKNVAEQLDEEEAEFRSIRRDLPGAKGAVPPASSRSQLLRRQRRTSFSAPIPSFDQ
jgi:hypothetical protein